MKQLYPSASRLFFSILLTLFSLFLIGIADASAQQVSGIITDFNGYWKSSVSGINAVKPNDSHNLLAFTYNGIQYSTGANDPLLGSHGESFVAGDFWAMPVDGITGTITSNTKVGWGEMKDGVHNGIGTLIRPEMNISQNLTDGIKGLDLGTCIANLPSGNLTFFVSNIKPETIGDGIPDILVTQIADPSGSTDRYSFVDNAGNLVGNKKNIVFTNINPVGNWTADFYEPLGSVLTLTSGFTNTDRPIRLWAADLSEFGITAANYQSVYKFKVELSGNSDVAFAGYNNRSFNLTNILPVSLTGFTGKQVDKNVQLDWSTKTEESTHSFIIERSGEDNHFQTIGEVMAKGNSGAEQLYLFTDKNPARGISYYRLKMMDNDGLVKYSPVVKVLFSPSPAFIKLYPNPCSGNTITVNYPAGQAGKLIIYSATGITLQQQAVNASGLTQLDIRGLEKGVYYAVWQAAKERLTISFLKQ